MSELIPRVRVWRNALDVALAEFSPPSYARPYLGSPNAPAKTQGGVI